MGYTEPTDWAEGFLVPGSDLNAEIRDNFIHFASGVWTDEPFDAGDFTGSGGMAWTVAEGDVVELAWVIRGKTMTVSFHIQTSTIVAPLGSSLLIRIPNGRASAGSAGASCWLTDNGTPEIARARTSGTSLSFKHGNGSNFAAQTNTFEIHGQVTFGIS